MQFLRTAIACLVFSPSLLAQTPQTVPGAKVELRLATLNAEDFAKFLAEYPNFSEKAAPGKAAQILTQAELEKLFVRLQSLRSIGVMQAQTVTVGDKRTASLICGDNVTLTTELEEKKVDGQSISVPKSETIQLGLRATISPKVAADRRSLSLKLDIKNTTIDPSVPLFPITTIITPFFEDGSLGQPIPFTQFVQRPNISNLHIESTVDLADHSSAALYMGRQMVPHDRQDPRTPMTKIPYVNRLFRKADRGKGDRESQHVIVFATASVAEMPLAQVLVEDYRKAVADGRLDEAKKLGIQAIQADPKCFEK